MKIDDRTFRETHEHAVSEAIGFTLIFSLVMVGIGLIMLYGYPVLLETQSNANVKNMERDMIVLQNDMKSLVYKNVPYKETSLQVSGGSLGVYNYSMSLSDSKFKISINNGSLYDLGIYDTGQLRYESDAEDSMVALENGAVIIRQEFATGSSMLAEPRWFNDTINNNQTFIINLIRLNTDSVLSRNGIGTVKMGLFTEPVYESFYEPAGMDVIITYTPDMTSKLDYSKAWSNYFVNTLKMTESPANVYTLQEVNNLIVKQYTIEIQSI